MITRNRRLFGAPLIAALIATILVASPGHAATTVTTWEELKDALATGGTVVVGADIAGSSVIVGTDQATTLDLAGHTVDIKVESHTIPHRGAAVIIEGDAHLTVTDSVGNGRLVAESNSEVAAVIGTRSNLNAFNYPPGKLTIDGAVVEALRTPSAKGNANGKSATVGGGYSTDGLDVTVLSGSLSAINHESGGAAIGGGYGGDGGTLTVKGGQVAAVNYGNVGAVIGGGYGGGGGTIAISGGDVTALGQANILPRLGSPIGAGIGGGYRGPGANMTVSGGTVTVNVNSEGAGIGAGASWRDDTDKASGGRLHVSGGTVVVTHQSNGEGVGTGIGGGEFGPGADVTLTGGVIDIQGGSRGASIGAGAQLGSNPVYEDPGTVTIAGTPLEGSPTTAVGPAAAAFTFTAPSQPTSVSIVNSSDDQPRTRIAFGHIINLDLAGGTLAQDQIFVIDGQAATAPSNPKRAGHHFVGWKLSGSTYNFTAPVTAPLTLTAAWDIHEYPVTFNSKGGSGVVTQTVEYGSKATEPKVPKRSGYVFKGWQHNGSGYNFNRAVTGPLTLTATWVKAANLVDVSSNKNSKYYTQFHREIQWLADQGITRGWAVGGGKHEFRPKDNITREAMAAFMYRYAGSPKVNLPSKSPFADVTPSNTNFYKEIIWMNQQGISTGWAVSGGKKEFRAKDDITRDAMAAFMYRFAGKPATTPPATSPFADVPKSSQFYKEVTWLANAGVSTGWTQPQGKPQYRPYDEISREAMAAFLYRLDRL